MARKTSPRQIIVALDRVVGVDMHHFFYMLQTGRYINDGRIVRAMNCGTINEAIRVVSDYGMFDAKPLRKESVATLKKKKWITATAIAQAKKIKQYAETKTRIMGR